MCVRSAVSPKRGCLQPARGSSFSRLSGFSDAVSYRTGVGFAVGGRRWESFPGQNAVGCGWGLGRALPGAEQPVNSSARRDPLTVGQRSPQALASPGSACGFEQGQPRSRQPQRRCRSSALEASEKDGKKEKKEKLAALCCLRCVGLACGRGGEGGEMLVFCFVSLSSILIVQNNFTLRNF